MRPLGLLTLAISFSSLLFSDTLSLHTNTVLANTTLANTILVCDVNKSKHVTVPKKLKKPESTYDKVARKLLTYRGTLIEDMFTYSIDMFVPDEMLRSGKDVLTNRQKEGFPKESEKVLQTLANDSLNVGLTTAYYYMQDMGRITERMWKNQACNPKAFFYDESIEPKIALLNLSECDSLARGVSKNDIVLPHNKNFPNALYPHASKPNGCSAEWLQGLYDFANKISDNDMRLKEVCNAHDRCYYTQGSNMEVCNSTFIVEVLDACAAIKVEDTLKYMGLKNAFCSTKGFFVASGANACARRYFANAQKIQKSYNLWVERYEKLYYQAEEAQNKQKEGL